MTTITPPAPSPVLYAEDAAKFFGANVRTLERWRHTSEGRCS
jgi:hypothetical protein